MKLLIISTLFSFIILNLYSQNNTVPDSSSINTIVKEKVNNQHFEYDNDDIYTGKVEADSLIYIDKEYENNYSEEEIYKKREHKRHIMRIFLNVSLLILWVFSHY